LFNINKWKFDKYCKLYADFFDAEVPHYTKVNYEALQRLMINHFNIMKQEEKLLKENIIKDKISEYKNVKVELVPFIGFIFAFIGYFLSDSIKKFSSSNSLNDFKLVQYYSFLSATVALYLIIITSKNSFQKTTVLGFWELCLNVLNMVNEDKFTSFNIHEKEIDPIKENEKIKID